MAARYAALLRTAYLLTGHHQDAEDLLQQSLVKAVGAWKRIDGDPEPYVRTILVRQNVSRWRSRRWRELTTDTLPGRCGSPTDGGRRPAGPAPGPRDARATPTCGDRAALLRGPHRGPDRRGARHRRRHRQVPGARRSPPPARGLRRNSPTCSFRPDDHRRPDTLPGVSSATPRAGNPAGQASASSPARVLVLVAVLGFQVYKATRPRARRRPAQRHPAAEGDEVLRLRRRPAHLRPRRLPAGPSRGRSARPDLGRLRGATTPRRATRTPSTTSSTAPCGSPTARASTPPTCRA